MDLEHYIQLPCGMEPADVASEFERLLAEAESSDPGSALVAEGFWELADRQWHTYEMMRPDLRLRVERWFHQHWLPSTDFIGFAGGVAAQLGLTGIIPLLERTEREFGAVELGREIREILHEISPHIEDPYWGMKAETPSARNASVNKQALIANKHLHPGS
jgi:hypothetical protein